MKSKQIPIHRENNLVNGAFTSPNPSLLPLAGSMNYRS